MREKIEREYLNLGININSNKILKEYLHRTEISDESLKKQIEFFHMDLIIGLRNIRVFDRISFERYIDTVNNSKENLNFWGEKFEIYFHSKLINGVPHLITDLRRGIDGLEPDLLFKYNDSQLGIELTTLKYKIPPKNSDQILSKITECILNKNSKKYSNSKCALIIDITNIVAYEKIFNLNLNNIFKESFDGFSYLQKVINFGMIILCNSVFKEKSDKTLFHELNPRIGIINEKKIIDRDLLQFLNTSFNNFTPSNDFNLEYYHQNI